MSGVSERDIELRVLGRVSQSGFGPGSDVCERVWAVLAAYGIHSDGKTGITEYIERLCIAARGSVAPLPPATVGDTLDSFISKQEIAYIRATLEHCGGSREKAASMLGISMAKLYRLVEKR